MASVLAFSVVDCGFEPSSGQDKDYRLVFVSSPLRSQHIGIIANTGTLVWNRDNVSKWSNMSTCKLASVSWTYKNPTRHVGLVRSGHHHQLIE